MVFILHNWKIQGGDFWDWPTENCTDKYIDCHIKTDELALNYYYYIYFFFYILIIFCAVYIANIARSGVALALSCIGSRNDTIHIYKKNIKNAKAYWLAQTRFCDPMWNRRQAKLAQGHNIWLKVLLCAVKFCVYQKVLKRAGAYR